MEQNCKSLDTCGFFKKYKDTKELACRGFITLYCKGEKMGECKRREFFEKNGVAPSDDMMPSGHMVVSNN